MKENLSITGMVAITLRDKDGHIKERETINLVLTVVKQHVADLLSGQHQAAMSHMAIGTGTTGQDLTDTQLEIEISRKAFVSKDQGAGGNANQVIYVCDWPSGDPAGTSEVTEAGIFNAASGGVMLCRTTFGAKTKGPADSLTLTWTLTVN